jgi:hypothetical protein
MQWLNFYLFFISTVISKHLLITLFFLVVMVDHLASHISIVVAAVENVFICIL